jgi:phage baseplate assembly protein W
MNDKSIDLANYGMYVEGADDIAQSWYNILHTIPGTDPLRQTFGSAIFDYLDRPVTVFQGEFQAQVIADLEKWEPRATISKVSVNLGLENEIDVQISGVYVESGKIITATISLSDLANADLNELRKAYSNAYEEEAYN